MSTPILKRIKAPRTGKTCDLCGKPEPVNGGLIDLERHSIHLYEANLILESVWHLNGFTSATVTEI